MSFARKAGTVSRPMAKRLTSAFHFTPSRAGVKLAELQIDRPSTLRCVATVTRPGSKCAKVPSDLPPPPFMVLLRK